MKKLIYILLLAVVAVGFVSCEEDRDSNPIWNEDAAKTFVLNMPAVAVNIVRDLEGAENVGFTTSHPD